MGKKSSKAPDAKGAAEKEGEYSRQAARDKTYADRPDQYNAFGNVTWQNENVIDPATGENTTKWTQRQNMSPEMKSIFDNQMGSNKRNSELAAGMGDRIEQEMGAPVNWNQFGDVQSMDFDPTQMRQDSEDAAYKRSTNRLDPQFEQQREALEIRLRNRGLASGDQAYESEMSRYDTGKNDAYEQARLGSTAEGRQEAAQGWDQALSGNERANALRDRQMQEYIAKRGFSKGEQDSLNPTAKVGEMASAFGGGST